MNENWKDIQGFEGLYQVSDKGRVRNVKTNHVYKQYDDNKYHWLSFRGKDGVLKHYVYIHRLVAQHFVPNPNNYSEVNHIDENKSNNCANNLEWCSHQYNNTYGTKIRRGVETRMKNGSYVSWNKGLHTATGENNPMYGKKHSEETKRKISESQRRRLLRAQTINEQLD